MEILQTYQRESRPIQDVYAQVTQLFNSAPDLLEDFKQFLPDPSAQKAQATTSRMNDDIQTSNVRSDETYMRNMPSATQTPKADKMPPIGHFGPPSVTKESKKRRAPGASTTVGSGMAQDAPASKITNLQGGSAAKVRNHTHRRVSKKLLRDMQRSKTSATKAATIEIPTPSPSLVPELPRPMPPSASKLNLDATPVIERIKKYLGNKQAWLEFLKLVKMYTDRIIDKQTLVSRIDDGFIGGNTELSSSFKRIIELSTGDIIIENMPAPSENKVVLSNCRALGPSYRLLPKRERFAKCSGRDEMCYQVLNDEWASHPTWASEDSGFISHKKNTFEEALYRMEEERHDYDFNIETAMRTIQLLEPLVQQMMLLDPEERKLFKLPYGLGGQSEAIWQRVIKKLYDRPMGCRVIEDMYIKPTKLCPIVLLRLKDKVEKWKQAQREWEKVWREQTHRQFWRSLDHQGINAKAENKKYFQPKALHSDIFAKFEEQRRQRQLKPAGQIRSYQLDYAFTDVEVIHDCCHMLLTYLRTSYANADSTKIEKFIKDFIPTFFGLDKENFLVRMTDVYNDTPPNEEDEDANANDGTPSHRGRRMANGKQNLLRGVLDPSKQGKKESRVNSKESTPDVMLTDDESATPSESVSDQPPRPEPSESRWMEHPRERPNSKLNEQFARNSFSLYANLNVYCFMRLFAMFYERLASIKACEKIVQEDVRRAVLKKPAMDLKIADRSPMDFFEDVSPTANYYRQVVKFCESCLEHGSDTNKVEDLLRRFYIPCGYQLYNYDKWLSNILKFAGQSIVNDTKDRSSDILNLFLSNRKEITTTHQTEIDYRKQVEKLAKDGDVYRIVYVSAASASDFRFIDFSQNQNSQHTTMQIFRKDDQTFDTDGRSGDFNWSYYVTAYVMRDWTEGVPHDIRWPYLRRNLPRAPESEEEFNRNYLPFMGEEGLEIRISPSNYRIIYENGTADWWVQDRKVRSRGLKGLPAANDERKSKFEEKFVKNAKWMANTSLDEVDKKKAEFNKLAQTEVEMEDAGATSATATAVPEEEPAEKPDEQMVDA